MKIDVVSIGNEVLSGITIDTNSSYISQKLLDLGYRVSRHIVLGDEKKDLQKGLQESLQRADIIIATGGLGPTFDDITKKCVAELFSLPLEKNQEVVENLKKRGLLKEAKDLSLTPKGAKILLNQTGTAPGFIFTSTKVTLILLPGVPQEMQQMFQIQVLPFLLENFSIKQKIYQERISLCLLKELDVEPILQKLQKIHKDVEIGIYPSFSLLRLHLTIKTMDEKKAKEKIAHIKEEIFSHYSRYIYSTKNETIQQTLHDIFLQKKKKLALAESCSGGQLATSFTSIPGSSQYFLGSIVAYSNTMKENILGVQKNTLKNKGAVSVETVEEMVKGVFCQTQADYAVAISGIAGPTGGTKEKPVGTVCLAIGERDKKIDAGIFYVEGDRQTVVDYTINFVLSLLWRRVMHNVMFF